MSQSSRSPLPSPQSTTGSLVEGLPGDGGASDHIHLHVRGPFGSHPFDLSILVRLTKHKEPRKRRRERKERGISRGKRRRERARACLLFIRRFSLRSIRVHSPWIRRRPVTPALSDRPHCFNLPPKHRRRHRSPFLVLFLQGFFPTMRPMLVARWTCARELSPSCHRPRRPRHRRHERRGNHEFLSWDAIVAVPSQEYRWQAKMRPVVCRGDWLRRHPGIK